MPENVCGGQKTTCWSWLSPLTCGLALTHHACQQIPLLTELTCWYDSINFLKSRTREISTGDCNSFLIDFLIDFFCFMYISVLFACIYVYHMHAWCSVRSEEGFRCPGTEVTGGCVTIWFWDSNTGPLLMQLKITETSLQVPR